MTMLSLLLLTAYADQYQVIAVDSLLVIGLEKPTPPELRDRIKLALEKTGLAATFPESPAKATGIGGRLSLRIARAGSSVRVVAALTVPDGTRDVSSRSWDLSVGEFQTGNVFAEIALMVKSAVDAHRPAAPPPVVKAVAPPTPTPTPTSTPAPPPALSSAAVSPSSTWLSWPVLTAVGLAVASAGVGTYFGIKARNDYDCAKDSTCYGAWPANRLPNETRNRNISFAVTGASALAAVGIWWFQATGDSIAHLALIPDVQHRAAYLSWAH